MRIFERLRGEEDMFIERTIGSIRAEVDAAWWYGFGVGIVATVAAASVFWFTW